MNKRGKAGRTMGKLYTIDSTGGKVDVNARMIDDGYAKKFGE